MTLPECFSDSRNRDHIKDWGISQHHHHGNESLAANQSEAVILQGGAICQVGEDLGQ